MGSDVRVELLSSLVKRTRDETAALREEMADPEGNVDVVVGTHALLADKVEWGRLGLLIVDEEQRFGVKQKERIKQKATEVDVLSLSATPIPRTLYMCLSGIRNMSVLATPPEGRLSVQTTLMERDDARMELAIRAELERGGQVFYVVPRIEMIADEVPRNSAAQISAQFGAIRRNSLRRPLPPRSLQVALLEQLLPDRTISYAHGGMRDLEKRVVSFTLGEVDVMVATTILENGIDIPNVNTIVIQHTHLFGLSQLHQLRGRVGRSNLQAYAYMMHPSPRELTEVALKRLRALKREGGLGAGFALAKEDMQLRGAGSLLGTAQKGGGGAAELGVDLYLEILQKAMAWLEQQKELGLDVSKVDSDQLAAAIGVSDLTEAIGLADSMDG